MKSYEFLTEDDDLSSIEANIIAALTLLAGKIKAGELPQELPTNMIIRYIRNTGVANFTVDNLADLNERNAELKNIIKSISGNRIVFATDNIKDNESDREDSGDEQADNMQSDQNVVSNMAKSAMKRRA